MPRAHTIWVFEEDGNVDAVFTVKHELLLYLSTITPRYDMWVYAYHDGKDGMRTGWPIREFLEHNLS